MDWLMLAVKELAPFFPIPAVGNLSGAAPYSCVSSINSGMGQGMTNVSEPVGKEGHNLGL